MIGADMWITSERVRRAWRSAVLDSAERPRDRPCPRLIHWAGRDEGDTVLAPRSRATLRCGTARGIPCTAVR
ncbi:hypothetical protein GCM10009533_13820 [Saccharopolyspora spinosporotrichia]|uniref:Uncharacterized protein n=1 Tax=Saccharopolyspora erythraea TaxID=1836 RepID=A0ABP3MD03_SACER